DQQLHEREGGAETAHAHNVPPLHKGRGALRADVRKARGTLTAVAELPHIDILSQQCMRAQSKRQALLPKQAMPVPSLLRPIIPQSFSSTTSIVKDNY